MFYSVQNLCVSSKVLIICGGQWILQIHKYRTSFPHFSPLEVFSYILIETMPNALTCHEHSLFDEADEGEQCNNFHSFQWHYQELSLKMRILQTRYIYLLTVSISLSNH